MDAASPVIPEPLRSFLPQPVLPERPSLVRLYEHAWAVGLQGAPVATQWEACFSVQWRRWHQGAFDATGGAMAPLDRFYEARNAEGRIPYSLNTEDNVRRTVPLFSWSEWDYLRHSGDVARAAKVLPVLAEFFDVYTRSHAREQGYLWRDLYRCLDDAAPRPDAWGWLDFTAQAALDCEALANLALEAGDNEIAVASSANYFGFGELVSTKMWNPWEKRFGDVDDFEVVVGHHHLGFFWPMLAGIATAPQIKEMIAALRAPRHFLRHHPLPLVAASDVNGRSAAHHRGGDVLPAYCYMIHRALRRAGHESLAHELALSHLEIMARVLDTTGATWSAYDSDTEAPSRDAVRDPGGSALVTPITGFLEDVLGVSVHGDVDAVEWSLHLAEPHGVRNLRVGSSTVDLQAAPSKSGWGVSATVDGNEVELTIRTPTTKRRHTVRPGKPLELAVK